MTKWIKRIVGFVFALVVIVAIAVVSLPLWLDPNTFKEDIQAVAAEQGVHLQLVGPISWRFFPTLGLSLNDVSVAPLGDQYNNLAAIKEMTAAVAVMPLFKKQIRVQELLVADANIQLIVTPDGKGNWEAFNAETNPQNNEPLSADTGSNSATNLDLNIASIRLSNATLVYDDRQNNQRTQLSEFDLTITDVNTPQQAFPLKLRLIAETPALSKPLNISLNSNLAVNSALNQFAITNGTLELPEASIELGLTTNANIENDLIFDGQLDANINNLNALFTVLGIEKPATTDPAVLSNVTLKASFNGGTQKISVPSLSFILDDTTLNGNASVTMPTGQSNLAVVVNIEGDTLNVDRYLPPPAEDTTTTTAASSTDAPLPLDALRNKDATLTFKFGELNVNNLPVTQLDMAVTGKRGLWQLEKFNAAFYQGALNTKGQLDARSNQSHNNQAKATIEAVLNGVALKPLLVDLAEVDVLRGAINAKVTGNTQASTTNQLMDNLIATIAFNGDSVVFDGINAEQKYCEMVTQVDANSETASTEQSPPATWPQETTVNELDGAISLNNSIITVDKLQAQVAYLALGTLGKLDLKLQDYEVSLPLTLTKNKTSENGCFVGSDFLINRPINVLGCKGNLAELAPAKQCGLRGGAISDLAKQALRYNAEKAVAKKVTPKVDEKKAELEEKKDEAKEKVRDRLKDLLNR